MALSDIRAALKTLLESVASIGVVNDYEPYDEREEAWRAHFKSASLDYLLGWTITREATAERDMDTERNWRDHLIVIRGIRAIGTGTTSEKDFQDLIEAVCVKLRAAQDDALSGVATLVGPPTVRIVQPRRWAGILVIYCEIAQRCTEAVTLT